MDCEIYQFSKMDSYLAKRSSRGLSDLESMIIAYDIAVPNYECWSRKGCDGRMYMHRYWTNEAIPSS